MKRREVNVLARILHQQASAYKKSVLRVGEGIFWSLYGVLKILWGLSTRGAPELGNTLSLFSLEFTILTQIPPFAVTKQKEWGIF